LALSAGVATAAVCFLVAGAAELAGIEPGDGEMTDLAAVLDGLLALTPWAWATLGAYAVIATPFVALVVTAWEYVSVDDRRGLLLALAVLGVLALSVLVAIWR
jgi:uncharacterized membrane protein